jgi:hypothetical protein
VHPKKLPPCSFGLSATRQQYFSLRKNQQSACSTFLSEQISTSHQPNEDYTREKSILQEGENLLDTKCLQHDEFTGKKASRDIQFHLAIWLISS